MSGLPAPRISLVGTGGLLFQAPGEFELGVQARLWQMASQAAHWPGVAEAVPGVTNLLLVFAAPPATPDPLTQMLLAAWDESHNAPIPPGRSVEIAVTYGGDDLGVIAERTGLDVAEVVRRHSAAEYRVFALGSQPGFAYLGGIDPTIAVPRKPVPVLEVPAGTVVIGGMQAAVVAAAGPNGWHAVGRSAVTLFDPMKQPPTLFAPGDRVHFRNLAASA